MSPNEITHASIALELIYVIHGALNDCVDINNQYCIYIIFLFRLYISIEPLYDSNTYTKIVLLSEHSLHISTYQNDTKMSEYISSKIVVCQFATQTKLNLTSL